MISLAYKSIKIQLEKNKWFARYFMLKYVRTNYLSAIFCFNNIEHSRHQFYAFQRLQAVVKNWQVHQMTASRSLSPFPADTDPARICIACSRRPRHMFPLWASWQRDRTRNCHHKLQNPAGRQTMACSRVETTRR